jgi:hypothetical protein
MNMSAGARQIYIKNSPCCSLFQNLFQIPFFGNVFMYQGFNQAIRASPVATHTIAWMSSEWMKNHSTDANETPGD